MDFGLMMKALEKVWYRTGDARYAAYIKKEIDTQIKKIDLRETTGNAESAAENLALGQFFLSFSQLQIPAGDKTKYLKAVADLWGRVKNQSPASKGGFLYGKQHSYRMLFEELLMTGPFIGEYSTLSGKPEYLDFIADQFDFVEKHGKDPGSGWIREAFDEKQGHEATFFSSSVTGLYVLALTEVLQYFPENHPKRSSLIQYLQSTAAVIEKQQDHKSGLWNEITLAGPLPRNFEISASAMFIYALARGVRMGYLPARCLSTAQKGFAGIFNSMNTTEKTSVYKLLTAGSPKTAAALIFAATEMEIAGESKTGAGKRVGLDYYFNREFRKGKDNIPEQFHYTWEDRLYSGFYWWGHIFRDLDADITSITEAPTRENLQKLSVYIIADPDTPKETEKPNYIRKLHIEAIESWVKQGGTLILMANDTANCEISNFNKLAQVFGVRFTDKNRNIVQGKQYEQGKLEIPEGNPVFKKTRSIYIKDLSILALEGGARPLLTDKGDVIMSITKYGKGRVFAVGDPWLYNEYVDGRLIGNDYQNFLAAKELAIWSLSPPRTPAPK